MDVAAVRDYLIGAGVTVSGDLRVELISGGRSNLTFKAHDDSSTWVIRRPPTTVVEYVSGVVIRDQADLAVLSDAQVESTTAALVAVLADLHAIDHTSVGLEKFGRPDGFTARQVKLWAGQWDRVKTRDLADVEALHLTLIDAVPSTSTAAIVHGDFRIDNTTLDAADFTAVRAVVDWEMSTLGDPLTDAALMCVYREPAFNLVLGMDAAWTSPRMASPDVLAQIYAQASGLDLAHWHFYLALAYFKLAVIAEGITHRALHGSDSSNSAIHAAEATPELIAAGLNIIGTTRSRR